MNKASVHTLDGKQLQLFLEVYECNSVSRAAERLGLTQSTVSHGLERLRRCLNDPLFIRDGRSIAPTAHADFLAPRIREALSALEDLAEPQLYDPSQDPLALTIAAHADDLLLELVHLYRALSQAAPQMPLHILNLGAPSNVRPLLESGHADLVIMARRGTLPVELDSEPLFSDHMATFFDGAMRGPIQTLAEFHAARHAVLSPGGLDQNMIEQPLARVPHERKVLLQVGDLGTLARLMKGTDLVATMQSRFGLSVMSEFDKFPPPFDLATVHYDLVWHRRQSLSRRLQWIRETVRSAIIGEDSD